ncbi:MAG: peptidase M19, partial [Anaerolineae bacterium]|nr:peptidase M19 [Anaerolineae bacterium]
MHIVDAHEDIAWNALALGRDVRRSALETRRLEQDTGVPQRNGLCMVGLPEWLSGGITLVCGTIFVSPARRGSPKSHTYATAEEAYALGQAQLDFYHRLTGE